MGEAECDGERGPRSRRRLVHRSVTRAAQVAAAGLTRRAGADPKEHAMSGGGPRRIEKAIECCDFRVGAPAAARRPPSIVSAQHGCACPTYCPAWCAYFASKAHLDAAGVVHGPHALHLLVHHLREPPASPSIRKDRRPCGRGWHLVSATDLRRGRSSSRGGRPAGRRTSGEEQKVTMVESMSTKRMDCACTGWRG